LTYSGIPYIGMPEYALNPKPPQAQGFWILQSLWVM